MVNAYSAQYWTVSWIDPDIGRLFLDGLAAAREGRADDAEKVFYASLWSKWGTKYKYRSGAPLVKKAKDAYSRSIDMDPTYAFGYYELANIELEAVTFFTRLYLSPRNAVRWLCGLLRASGCAL